MLNGAVGALALLLTAGAAPAQIQGAPKLQLSRLNGRVQVELKSRVDPDVYQQLPVLPSGSFVRMLSGGATFDSDAHATVRAYEGDEFQFTAASPEKDRPAVLRIAADDQRPSSLEVSVANYKFRLKKGGTISLVSRWPGEMTVRSEGRGVEYAPGSALRDGSILTRARKMPSGDSVTMAVPQKMDFENPAISSSALVVSTLGPDAYIVQAGWPLEPSARQRSADARRALSDWPAASQRMAEAIMEKYGPPDMAVSSRLVWYDNGPWTITAVYRNPSEHLDVLEQTISYGVPQEKVAALAALDLGLRLGLGSRELSSASESEETNFLALNVADEVLREKKSPEEARAFYLKTIVESNAGKSSPYMQKLVFR